MPEFRIDAKGIKQDGDLTSVELSRGGQSLILTVQEGMTAEDVALMLLSADRPSVVSEAWNRRYTVEFHVENDGDGDYYVIDSVTPEQLSRDRAREEFLALGDWATWTGDQAADWIEDNVVDLASAKVALRVIARAICALRDWRENVLDVAE